MKHPGILKLRGAHNGMAAIQAKRVGFDGLYLSGAAMTASMGLPDLGIITVDEVGFFIRQITRASGLPLAVARGRLYMEAGADAIFPEALNTEEMFRAFAKQMPGVPLLANMTEFGKTPFFTAAEFEAMGYAMVIWPVSALRVANKAQEQLYAAIARDGGTHNVVDRMQTRAELYATIGLYDYEALDASIVQTIIPEGMPQRRSSTD
jgi:2-methylisocitrate lyase-like PEP mutase family enzyme